MKKYTGIFSGPSASNSMHLKQILATILLSLVLSPAAMSAGIYKWTDAEGKIHYGSQRPEETEAEKMELHVSQPAASPKKSEADKEAKTTGITEVDDKAKQERTAYCASERKRLKTVEMSKTIHEKDATGKVVKLAAEERNQRLNQIRANITKYCK